MKFETLYLIKVVPFTVALFSGLIIVISGLPVLSNKYSGVDSIVVKSLAVHSVYQ